MKNIPEWALKWKAPGIEFQQRGNRIYAYRITSRYNPKKKRAQKITLEYLGVVTPKGIIKVRDTPKKYSVYEYGNVEFIASVSKDIIEFLKRHFDEWKEIFSIALRGIKELANNHKIPLIKMGYFSNYGLEGKLYIIIVPYINAGTLEFFFDKIYKKYLSRELRESIASTFKRFRSYA